MKQWRGALVGWSTAVALSVVTWPAGAQGQAAQTGQTPPIPVPRPFPQPNQPSSTTPPPPTAPPPSTAAKVPAQPAPPAAVTPAAIVNRPTERDLGVPVYPAADYLDSYDAGHGQRYYLFGTNAAFADIVAYYRNTLHDSGHELFKAPAMRQFDLGKFRDDTMAYPAERGRQGLHMGAIDGPTVRWLPRRQRHHRKALQDGHPDRPCHRQIAGSSGCSA